MTVRSAPAPRRRAGAPIFGFDRRRAGAADRAHHPTRSIGASGHDPGTDAAPFRGPRTALGADGLGRTALSPGRARRRRPRCATSGCAWRFSTASGPPSHLRTLGGPVEFTDVVAAVEPAAQRARALPAAARRHRRPRHPRRPPLTRRPATRAVPRPACGTASRWPRHAPQRPRGRGSSGRHAGRLNAGRRTQPFRLVRLRVSEPLRRRRRGRRCPVPCRSALAVAMRLEARGAAGPARSSRSSELRPCDGHAASTVG